MTFELDTRQMDDALKAVTMLTERTMPEAIDRAMASVLYRNKRNVIKKTVRVTPSKIQRELRRGKGAMLAKLAVKSLVKKGVSPTRAAVATEMDRIVARRKASSRYLIAGWAKPARLFGATRIKPPSSRSIASNSSGTKSKQGRAMFSEAINSVAAVIADEGAHRSAFNAMQEAIDEEATALVGYVAKKLDRSFQKVRPRGGRRG